MASVRRRLRLWLPLVSLAHVSGYYPSDVSDERNMTLIDWVAPDVDNNSSVGIRPVEPLVSVSVVVAAFGRSINDTTRINLLLPPTDDFTHLCELPTSVEERRRIENGADPYTEATALYVSDRGCRAEQKAAVAQDMQSIVHSVKYLVIQESDVFNNTPRGTFDAALDESRAKFKVGIILVPAEFATTMASALAMVRQSTSISPHFLDDNSTDWIFRFHVQGISNEGPYDYINDDDTPSRRQNFHPSSENYNLLRGFLFGLLIAAPCVRAAFLWYTGGGRLHWRRNAQGRIVGIQHVPPVPYWLAIGRPLAHSDVPVRLTEEQFATLPEIQYQRVVPSAVGGECKPDGLYESDTTTDHSTVESVEKPRTMGGSVHQEKQGTTIPASTNTEHSPSMPDLIEENDERDGDGDVHVRVTSLTASVESSNSHQREKDIEQQMSPNVSMDEKDAHESIGTEDDCAVPILNVDSMDITTVSTLVAESEAANESQPAVDLPPGETEPTRACTTCAICIEDFVPGETLILLPRCHHSFHKDCIHPWLLERQGCCPTCKTTALPEEDTEGD